MGRERPGDEVSRADDSTVGDAAADSQTVGSARREVEVVLVPGLRPVVRGGLVSGGSAKASEAAPPIITVARAAA
jgi:hypothetical protein